MARPIRSPQFQAAFIDIYNRQDGSQSLGQLVSSSKGGSLTPDVFNITLQQGGKRLEIHTQSPDVAELTRAFDNGHGESLVAQLPTLLLKILSEGRFTVLRLLEYTKGNANQPGITRMIPDSQAAELAPKLLQGLTEFLQPDYRRAFERGQVELYHGVNEYIPDSINVVTQAGPLPETLRRQAMP